VYVPFHELVNAETLRTEVRYIALDSDFHRLARFLERGTSAPGDWKRGPRPEPGR
jgi:hypothetical protein